MSDTEIIEREDDCDEEEGKCKECCKCCCCCCYEVFFEDAVEEAQREAKRNFWDALEDNNPECYNKLMCICCLCCIFRTMKKRKQRQAKVVPSKESEKSDEGQVVEPTETPSDVIKDQPKPSQCDDEVDEIGEVNSDPVTEKESTNNEKQRGQNRRQNRRR